VDKIKLIALKVLERFKEESLKGPVSKDRREEILAEEIQKAGKVFSSVKDEVLSAMKSLHLKDERKAS